MTKPDLTQPLSSFFRISLKHQNSLEKMGIHCVRDLLFHFPHRYVTHVSISSIKEAPLKTTITVCGTITHPKAKKTWRSKTPLAEARLHDHSGSLRLVWFNQPFIAKMFKENTRVTVTGTISETNGARIMINPHIELFSGHQTHTYPHDSLFSIKGEENKPSGPLIPVYPEARNISSRWIHYAIKRLLQQKVEKNIEDPIPQHLRKKYHLPSLATALYWIHLPRNEKEVMAARKRFSFEEVFYIQISRLLQKKAYQGQRAYVINTDKTLVESFIQSLPFTPTGAQRKALSDVMGDVAKETPMMRLLEGDVGSGKTFIAAALAYAAAHTHLPGKDYGALQTAIMVPTEVLARQHFSSLIDYFSHSPIPMALITSSECRKFPSKINKEKDTHISRSQLLRWVENGEIPVIIGTHSLIQEKVSFKNLAVIIIDEQHRFGVMQRARLTQKKSSRVPHLLSMTATPIPRTLALTIYGDLDLSLIDEMPHGRKPVKTTIVPEKKRAEIYSFVDEKVKEGRQAYVICPRIEAPDPAKEKALNVASAEEERKRLKTVFPHLSIDILHSKLPPKKKEEIMQKFAEGKTNILVATSVVEVGVNVPNATIIIIEGAERFGLAQLHQLRGRVARSSEQAHCFIFTNARGRQTRNRLLALLKAKNGFELAEMDLAIRGEGTLSGEKQWGVSDVGMEAIKNIKMVEAARIEAETVIKNTRELKRLMPIVEQRHQKNQGVPHLE